MSLNDVWEGAAGSPFYPAVAKDRQFLVAFTLLLTGNAPERQIVTQCIDSDSALVLSGLFGLSE